MTPQAKKGQTKEMLRVSDAMLDLMEEFEVPDDIGLAALAYTLGTAAGTAYRLDRLTNRERMLDNLLDLVRESFKYGATV